MAPLAVAAAAALAVSGCTTTATAPVASGGTITVAEVNELTSFNPATPAGNLDINTKIQGYTRSSFFYIDNKLNIVPDKSFGTVTKVSDKPLTVKYTLAKNLTWSDGKPPMT
jgi:peptide/nickel transport system substrate-binding protein